METKEELELKRLQREIQKLDAEHRELTRPWYRRPAWVAALSPVVLAALAVLTASLSGFFDRTRVRLQQENTKIAEKVAQLETKAEQLHEKVVELEPQIAELEKEKKGLKKTLSEAEKKRQMERMMELLHR